MPLLRGYSIFSPGHSICYHGVETPKQHAHACYEKEAQTERNIWSGGEICPRYEAGRRLERLSKSLDGGRAMGLAERLKARSGE